MRMPPDHFLGNGVSDITNIKRIMFRCHLAVEHDLEKQVAQFLLEVRHVATLNRISDLVSLLNRIGCDCREILLEVPCAA